MAESRPDLVLCEGFCIAHIRLRAQFAPCANNRRSESSCRCAATETRGDQIRVTAGLFDMKVMNGRRFTAWMVMKAEAQAAMTQETK
jgi:hypothetical protein